MARRMFYGALAMAVVYAMIFPGNAGAKPKGEIRVAIETMSSETWPGPKAEYSATVIIMGVTETLLRINSEGEIVPCLAESYEMSPDGKTYTLKIRKGIPFHEDWGELSAHDVKFSFDLAMAEDSLCIQKGYFVKEIESIDVVDDYTVKIQMVKPHWDLPTKLIQHSPSFWITSKKYFDTVGEAKASRHPIGTGPFKFVEHRLGEYVKLEAVENHWRKTPAVKTVTIKKVPEVATGVAMVRRGIVDLFMITPEFIKEVEKIPDAKIIPAWTHELSILLMGQYLPTAKGYDPSLPYAPHVDELHDWRKPETLSDWNSRSLKVRQALDLAVDKETIIEHVMFGYGKPLEVPLFFQSYPGFDPAWEPYPYNPEKAKELLAEAGYKPGDIKITLALTHHTLPLTDRVAEAIGQYWTELGLDVAYESMDYVQAFKPRAHDRMMGGYAFSSADPFRFDYTMYMVYIAYSKSWYGWMFDDPEFDKMMDAAMVELDPTKREKIMNEMGDYVYKGRLAIPISYVPRIFAASSKIKEWPLSPAGAYVACNLEYLVLND